MRNRVRIAFWLLWFVAAGALPAYANNPPAPDGMFSLILIFPVAIFAFRWAGGEFTDKEKEKRRRITKGILLGLSTLVAGAGTEIGAAAMLVLLTYGLLRGGQVMRRGQCKKRFAIGSGVLLFTLFACSDYLLSTSNYPVSWESRAVTTLINIVSAETTFKSAAKLDANKNEVGEYGSLTWLKLVASVAIRRRWTISVRAGPRCGGCARDR